MNPNGTTTTVADLSVFQKANPVAHPEPDDFEPDGTWYSMIALRGKLYAVEPNHGELDEISTTGVIRRILDVRPKRDTSCPRRSATMEISTLEI